MSPMKTGQSLTGAAFVVTKGGVSLVVPGRRPMNYDLGVLPIKMTTSCEEKSRQDCNRSCERLTEAGRMLAGRLVGRTYWGVGASLP